MIYIRVSQKCSLTFPEFCMHGWRLPRRWCCCRCGKWAAMVWVSWISGPTYHSFASFLQQIWLNLNKNSDFKRITLHFQALEPHAWDFLTRGHLNPVRKKLTQSLFASFNFIFEKASPLEGFKALMVIPWQFPDRSLADYKRKFADYI